MARNIVTPTCSVKRHFTSLVPQSVILQCCQAINYRWRERKFGPAATVYFFILQILHGNTAILHLRHLTATTVNAAAYCKARARLPLALLELLLDHTAQAASQGSKSLWPAMRVFLTDCTSSLAPDTPSIRKIFRQAANIKPRCGFPMPKIMALFDAASGAILQPFFSSLYVHEASRVWKLHPLLKAGDLLIGDRAFCSYVHLVMLAGRNIFGLFRVQQQQNVSFRPGRKHGKKGQPTSRFVKRLGKWDQLVEWFKPQSRPKWMSKKQFDALPAALIVREVRYRIAARGQRTRQVTIATTLLDPKLYPAEKIAELYGCRWRVETHFGQMKTTMKMSRLKCKSAEGVKKELLAYFIAYNLICRVMRQAADRQKLDIERISFIDAMRWLANAREGDELIVLVIIAYRPDRHEPRVTKYLKYRYRSMTKPRSILKKKPYLYSDKPK
jgi:hypothetical protein